MANYIHTLQADNHELKARLALVEAELVRLLGYYTSAKFHGEDVAYVRTDILPRLDYLRQLTTTPVDEESN